MSNISTATLTGNIKDTTTITGHLDYPVISGTKEITSNGTYDISKYQEVNVNTPQPSGDITINENGTYNVLEYENAIVETSGIVPTGTLDITSNGEYEVSNYEKANVNTFGYTLLYSTEKEYSSTSSTQTIDSIPIGDSIWSNEYIIYVRIRDKVGKRNDYFYGSDNFFLNNKRSTYLESIRNIYYILNNTLYTSTLPYGVYGRGISNTGILDIGIRYNSSYRTIDGTYTIEVYKLDYPDGISPFI